LQSLEDIAGAGDLVPGADARNPEEGSAGGSCSRLNRRLIRYSNAKRRAAVHGSIILSWRETPLSLRLRAQRFR